MEARVGRGLNEGLSLTSEIVRAYCLTPPPPFPVSDNACLDSEEYVDPVYGASCAGWVGYICDEEWGLSTDQTQELQEQCPVSCNVPCDLGRCSCPCLRVPHRCRVANQLFFVARTHLGNGLSCDASAVLPNAVDLGDCSATLVHGGSCSNSPNPGLFCSPSRCLDGSLNAGVCAGIVASKTVLLQQCVLWRTVADTILPLCPSLTRVI